MGGVLIVVALAVLSAACGPPAYEARVVPGGSLQRHDGMWVAHVHGAPDARGRALGELLGPQMRWALPRFLRAVFRRENPGGHVAVLRERLAPGIPAPAAAQLNAMATAAGVSLDALLVVNLAPELGTGLMCTAASAPPPPGQPLRAGRNLDWPGGRVLKDLGLIVVESGPDIETFAHVTWPGLVGVVTGMNAHGVFSGNLVVLNDKSEPAPGVPVMFAQRDWLAHARTAEAVAARLVDTRRTIAQSYIVADPQGAWVAEVALSRVARRGGGPVAIANLHGETVAPRPDGRYARLRAAMEKPGSTRVAELKAALADVALAELNVQAVVAVPARRALHVATEGRPAAAGPWTRVDLSRWLSARHPASARGASRVESGAPTQNGPPTLP